MDDLEFRCYFAIGLWLIFTSPNKPKTLSQSQQFIGALKSHLLISQSPTPQRFTWVGHRRPTLACCREFQDFFQGATLRQIQSCLTSLEQMVCWNRIPHPQVGVSFWGYLLGWTNVYKRLHKLTALVFLGIHLNFACRFVVVSLGWFLERKE